MLALLVVGSGLAGGLYLYGHETLSAIGPHSAPVKKAQKDLQVVPPPSEPATALVVGYDARAGAGGFGAKDSRSDTLMLIRADPRAEHALAPLVPARPATCRSTATPRRRTPSTGSTPRGRLCGPQGTLDTVQKLTGIPVNYLITARFPRLQADREQAARRLHERRPPLSTSRRTRAVRDDQPRARLPAARRPGGARLRPLPCTPTTTSTGSRASSSSSRRSRTVSPRASR